VAYFPVGANSTYRAELLRPYQTSSRAGPSSVISAIGQPASWTRVKQCKLCSMEGQHRS
jgi:hypothetical protein